MKFRFQCVLWDKIMLQFQGQLIVISYWVFVPVWCPLCQIYVFYCGYVVFKKFLWWSGDFSPAKNRRSKDDFGVVCNKGFDSLTCRQAGAQPDIGFDP